MKALRPFLVLCACIAWSTPSGAVAAGTVELLVFERKPYYVRAADGTYHGVIADRVTAAFRGAGIDYHWVEMPPNGHLRTIAADMRHACAVGWFKLPEREGLGIFTAPIYRDRPQVVLTRTDNRAVARHRFVHDLLADDSVSMGAKLGYSYGEFVDGLARDLGTVKAVTSTDDVGLMRMLVGRRFDYVFAAAEEAEALQKAMGEQAEEIAVLVFEDIPLGNWRHLLCAYSVGEGVVARLDAALAALPGGPP